MKRLPLIVDVFESYDKRTGERRIEIPELPHYSTNMSSAWEVIEHLKKEEHFILLTDHGAGGGYFCCIDNGEAFADTAPHAICLAALEAVEEP